MSKNIILLQKASAHSNLDNKEFVSVCDLQKSLVLTIQMWNQWKSAAQSRQASRDDAFHKLRLTHQRRAIAHVFVSWKQAFLLHRDRYLPLEQKTDALLRRKLKERLKTCFSRWAQYSKKRTKLNVVWKTISWKSMHSTATKFFHIWKHTAAESTKKSIQLSETAAAFIKRRQDEMKSPASRQNSQALSHALLHKTFAAWRDMSRLRREELLEKTEKDYNDRATMFFRTHALRRSLSSLSRFVEARRDSQHLKKISLSAQGTASFSQNPVTSEITGKLATLRIQDAVRHWRCVTESSAVVRMHLAHRTNQTRHFDLHKALGIWKVYTSDSITRRLHRENLQHKADLFRKKLWFHTMRIRAFTLRCHSSLLHRSFASWRLLSIAIVHHERAIPGKVKSALKEICEQARVTVKLQTIASKFRFDQKPGKSGKPEDSDGDSDGDRDSES